MSGVDEIAGESNKAGSCGWAAGYEEGCDGEETLVTGMGR